MDMHDVQLVQSTKMRNAASIKEDEIFTLKPSLQSLDGSLKMCECGEVYTEEKLAGVATLYTRIGGLQCNYYNLTCKNGSYTLEFHEAAAEKSIYFFNKGHSSRR